MEKSIKEFHNYIQTMKNELETQISPPKAAELSHIIGLQWLILWRLHTWGYFDHIHPNFHLQLEKCMASSQSFFVWTIQFFESYRKFTGPNDSPKSKILQDHAEHWQIIPLTQLKSINLSNECFVSFISYLNSLEWDNWPLLDFNFFIGNVYESCLVQDDRKTHGVYYTPQEVCVWMVKQAITQYLELSKQKRAEIQSKTLKKIRIMDPAVGSGHFIECCMVGLLEFWHQIDPSANVTMLLQEIILLKNISGYDLNPIALSITKVRLILHLFESFRQFPNTILNKITLQIACQNSLLQVYSPQDIIIGNPPFGGTLSQEEVKALVFDELSKKNLAKAFVLKSLTWLDTDGLLCFILPKAITYTKDWQAIRTHLLPALVGLYDMKQAFEGVLLEQVIIFLQPSGYNTKYTANSLGSSHIAIEIQKRIIQDTWYCDLTPEELSLLTTLFTRPNITSFSQLIKTFRGLPLQSHSNQISPEKIQKNPEFIGGGKDLTRYALRPLKQTLFFDHIPNVYLKNLPKYQVSKLIFQNIVAYISKPVSHIRVMGTFDSTGILIYDTVNVVQITKRYDSETDPFVVLGLMNSLLFSFLMHRLAFNKAVRTMHLDNYALNKVFFFPGPFLSSSKIHNLVSDLLSVGWSVQKYLLIEQEILAGYGLSIKQMPADYYALWQFVEKGDKKE